MKRMRIFVFVIAASLLSACNKRQFTCECTIPGAQPSDFTITDTQKNAQAKCQTYSTPGPPPTTCALK